MSNLTIKPGNKETAAVSTTLLKSAREQPLIEIFHITLKPDVESKISITSGKEALISEVQLGNIQRTLQQLSDLAKKFENESKGYEMALQARASEAIAKELGITNVVIKKPEETGMSSLTAQPLRYDDKRHYYADPNLKKREKWIVAVSRGALASPLDKNKSLKIKIAKGQESLSQGSPEVPGASPPSRPKSR